MDVFEMKISEDDLNRVAYLYFKYALRHETPLKINGPKFTNTNFFMATRLGVDPWDFCSLVEGALREISSGNMNSTEEDEKLSISRKHELAHQAVRILFKAEYVVVDVNSKECFDNIMKFVAVTKIPWQHAYRFFNALFTSRFLDFFKEEKWSEQRFFIA